MQCSSICWWQHVNRPITDGVNGGHAVVVFTDIHHNTVVKIPIAAKLDKINV